jgi:GT2 family glycosyltransferase
MRFSVVIPTFRRRPTLERVLDAWERQEPSDLPFEVVVVDDGSGDGTAELLAQVRPRRYRFRFASQENGGPARARNRALAMARGEIVLFTGDDIEPAPDLLAEHDRGHLASGDPRVAILGLTRWPQGGETTATMRHIDGPGAQQFSYHFFEDGAEYDFRHLYTSNVSVHRELLDQEPTGFSEDFPAAAFEDAEFGYRLALHGLRIRYRRAAVAYHHHPYDARGFFRRQWRCGEMAAVLYGKLPELRRHLDLGTLESARITLLHHHIEGEGEGLPLPVEAVEERALRIATFYDPLPQDPIAPLLFSLFRLVLCCRRRQREYQRDCREQQCGNASTSCHPSHDLFLVVSCARFSGHVTGFQAAGDLEFDLTRAVVSGGDADESTGVVALARRDAKVGIL